MNGNKFHDEVAQTFLSDYEGTTNVLANIPDEYSFTDPKTGKILPPTLMQGYVAYKVKTQPFFGNFSSVGTGKTLSAILASRVIGSKMTVVVCPNDVVKQWKYNIIEAFPNSYVITDRDRAFNAKYDENKYQYLVLNYDKFSQDNSQALIGNLVREKIDFVVLDEIHFTKSRSDNDAKESQRRRNLERLMTHAREKNRGIKVLGMSATPVINDLMEGRSLIEIMSGKIYDDIAVRPTPSNAANLFSKLSLHSVRQKQKYADIKTNFIDVQAPKPDKSTIMQLKAHPLLMEQILTEARIPEIIKNIQGKTIIYTEYVTKIVEKLHDAVQAAGYECGLYTGDRRDDLTKFTDGHTQVLVASRPISVGVDGLQKICNRIIINTLPWTHAQWEQLVGRLGRIGQESQVQVFIISASIGALEYDKKIKWDRIQYKKTLGDCAVDGILPENLLVTPHQATMEAIKWLERLERDEFSSVTRADLNVRLSASEIEKRIVKYGDFAQINKQFNSEKSDVTHEKITNNPEILVEYHRQFREVKKGWPIKPVEVIAEKIKALRLPPRLISKMTIGDFGCGEAELAQLLRENKVYSFDHHNVLNESIVIACDMKKTQLNDGDLDVAVFSLSLMGRNWSDYIIEAKRCLVKNGFLFIAETTKSLKLGLSKLPELLKEQGFEVYSSDEMYQFTFIEARKL